MTELELIKAARKSGEIELRVNFLSDDIKNVLEFYGYNIQDVFPAIVGIDNRPIITWKNVPYPDDNIQTVYIEDIIARIENAKKDGQPLIQTKKLPLTFQQYFRKLKYTVKCIPFGTIGTVFDGCTIEF